VYLFSRGVYNVYFHPLARYPGSIWYTAYPLAQIRNFIEGTNTINTKKLHDKYGDVVRVAKDTLSFIDPAVSKDIYIRSGREELMKDPTAYRPAPGSVPNIIHIRDKKEHAQHRSLLANSFSERAMRDQEPLIMKYVNLLIQRLHEHCHDGPLDMSQVYNWTTFDLISDLSYGEPFGCLEGFQTHPWMKWQFAALKASSYRALARKFPFGMEIMHMLVPEMASVLEKGRSMFEFTKEKSLNRIRAKTDRKDFVSAVMENDKDVHLTDEQMISLFNTLVLAGSETTATALTGVTSLLAENRDKLAKVTKEVRDTFKTEDEITIITANSLKYMNAVLMEAIRIFPPVPGGGPRLTKGDEEIAGHFVPKGTIVFYHQYSSYHTERNFKDPEEYVPERWLDDERYANDNKTAFRPFLSGPRNCIGINLANTEMRLILARILWNFDLGEPTWKGRYTEGRRVFVLWEKPALMLNLIPRRDMAN